MVISRFGVELPHSSLFAVSRREKVNGRLSRPSHHFWLKAVLPITLAPGPQPEDGASQMEPSESNSSWLDLDAPSISASEDEPCRQATVHKPKKTRSFARLRQISFRSFVPSVGSNKNSTVVSTEIASQKLFQSEKGSKQSGGTHTVFKSLRIKSRGAKTEMRKMMAVVKDRISSSSPLEAQPKTWDEFHRLYADGRIDIINPPMPPMEPAPEGTPPTAFQEKVYAAPKPTNEEVRQLVVNRLGLYGSSDFDVSEEANVKAMDRLALGDKLMNQGQEPQSLDEAWERSSSRLAGDGKSRVAETHTIAAGVRSFDLPPETLEQHPIFRKIVNQCRMMFGTWASFMSILDGERQIFLAESGLGGLREAPRHVSFCAHTILNGRKGFTVLDTHKDWRFVKNPLALQYGIRFYAGVPLMAPNLDGSPESEKHAVPLGTLCVADTTPRGAFGPAERKKLVYMAEFARRELEKWFVKKMEQKSKTLEASQKVWRTELERVATTDTAPVDVASESRSDLKPPPRSEGLSPTYSSVKMRRSFCGFHSSSSNRSTPPTSPSSCGNVSLKPPVSPMGRSLFEDITVITESKLQQIFDLATKLVCQTLDLSLVYLLAVAPHGESEDLGRTHIISSQNIPHPIPVFDAGLHLRVLRSPEGGLLYQNPNNNLIAEATLQPKVTSTESSQQSSTCAQYASAMLIAVESEYPSNGAGFVLAGYTSDTRRVFGGEDVSYMKVFARELEKYTCRLRI